jgi:alpha-beta hydrolase superfamily lysophospholipase
MSADEFQFETADGLSLHVRRWSPAAAPRAVVLIVHGMAEHAGRYARLAAALNGEGYEVVAPDLRGHGKSIADPDHPGFFAAEDGWNKAIGDIKAITSLIRRQSPGKPVILLGHSMGSFMAQRLMIEQGNEYAGVILSGTNGPVGLLRGIGAIIARIEVLRCGVKNPSGLLTSMSFGAYNKPYDPPRTEFDWLSRDDTEVDKYVADPLCGFAVSTSLWRDFLDGLGKLHGPQDISGIPKALPILIVSGTRDPVGGYAKGVQKLLDLYAGSGLANVSRKLYDDARHEIFNETNRDEVTSDIIEWLSELEQSGQG